MGARRDPTKNRELRGPRAPLHEPAGWCCLLASQKRGAREETSPPHRSTGQFTHRQTGAWHYVSHIAPNLHLCSPGLTCILFTIGKTDIEMV